jgi:hypothetical protein
MTYVGQHRVIATTVIIADKPKAKLRSDASCVSATLGKGFLLKRDDANSVRELSDNDIRSVAGGVIGAAIRRNFRLCCSGLPTSFASITGPTAELFGPSRAKTVLLICRLLSAALLVRARAASCPAMREGKKFPGDLPRVTPCAGAGVSLRVRGELTLELGEER